MVNSINGTLPPPDVRDSRNVTNNKTDDPRETGDVEEVERNDRVTLSDSTQEAAPPEEEYDVENEEAARQASEESSQNEPPGSNVDILT